ncbi:hypothetical protein ACOMHN_064012 [Nucella lapillus]
MRIKVQGLFWQVAPQQPDIGSTLWTSSSEVATQRACVWLWWWSRDERRGNSSAGESQSMRQPKNNKRKRRCERSNPGVEWSWSMGGHDDVLEWL